MIISEYCTLMTIINYGNICKKKLLIILICKIIYNIKRVCIIRLNVRHIIRYSPLKLINSCVYVLLNS